MEKSDIDRLLQDRVVFDLFSARLAELTAEKVENQARGSRERIGFLITILGALFVAAVTGVASLTLGRFESSIKTSNDAFESRLTTQMSEVVRKLVDERISEQLPDIRNEAAQAAYRGSQEAVAAESKAAADEWERITKLMRVDLINDQIEEAEAFSETQALSLIEILISFASNDQYKLLPEFSVYLENTIDHFAEAGRSDLVSRLEPVFGDIMLSSEGIVHTMVVTLGRELAGSDFAPNKISDGYISQNWTSKYSSYEQYRAAANATLQADLPYYFDLLIACTLEKPEEEINLLVRRARSIDTRYDWSVADTYISNFFQKQINDENIIALNRGIDCFRAHSSVDSTGKLAEIISQFN